MSQLDLPGAARASMWRRAAPYAIIAALCVLCYYNTLSAGFVNWDDPKLITENHAVHGLSWQNLKAIWTAPIQETYLPVRATSYAVDYSIWGMNPLGFHLTNIILHILVSILVFVVARRLSGTVFAGLAAAIIFAAHPVHTEPVAWASGRKDLLSTLLLLFSYYLYLRATGVGFRTATPAGGRRIWILIAVSLFVFMLSGLAKAMVVTLPLLIILTDLMFPRDGQSAWRERRRSWALYFLAAAIVGFIAWHFASAAGAIRPWHFGSIWKTAAFMCWAFLYYIKTMLAPSFLSARYPYGDTQDFGVPSLYVYLAPVAAALIIIILVRLVYVVVKARRIRGLRRLDFAIFGVAWFVIALLPVMNIVSLNVLVADRYLYLPSVGFSFAAATVCWSVWSGGSEARRRYRRSLAIVLVGVIAILYVPRTIERNRVWHDDLSLWSSVVDEFPDSRAARLYLASAYAAEPNADYDRAMVEVVRAQALEPHDGAADLVRGKLLLKTGRPQAVIEALESCRSLGLPGTQELYDSYFYEAAALEALNNPAQAQPLLEKAIEIDSERPEGYNNLGELRARMGDAAGAMKLYAKALTLDPGFTQAWYNLGVLAAARGDIAGAQLYYRRALATDPRDAQSMVNLASIWIDAGKPAGAVGMLERALWIDPNLLPAHANLARAYLTLRQYPAAKAEAQAALNLAPGNPSLVALMQQIDQANPPAAQAQGAGVQNGPAVAPQAPKQQKSGKKGR